MNLNMKEIYFEKTYNLSIFFIDFWNIHPILNFFIYDFFPIYYPWFWRNILVNFDNNISLY